MLLVVASITLWPTPVDRSGGPALEALLERLHGRGLPEWVDYVLVERAANVVMFVPYGALLAAQLPSRGWWVAVVLPALTSVLIEVVQLVALPGRHASGWDVVANTAGALLGLGLVAVATTALRPRSALPVSGTGSRG